MSENKQDWKDKIAELLYDQLKYGCMQYCDCNAQCVMAENLIEQVLKLASEQVPEYKRG